MDISKKFGGMTQKVRGLTDRGRDLAEKSRSMLKPPPVIFGSPRQLALEPDTSWWYVPVFIKPQTMHRKSLANCRVVLISLEGGNSALNMRWVRANARNSVPDITLEDGQLYFVPFAARKESAANRIAVITNEGFIIRKKVAMQMRAGRSQWVLRVENADGNWESGVYELVVPAPDRGNGHFTLEMRYDGLD